MRRKEQKRKETIRNEIMTSVSTSLSNLFFETGSRQFLIQTQENKRNKTKQIIIQKNKQTKMRHCHSKLSAFAAFFMCLCR